jgi:hypothetical protein
VRIFKIGAKRSRMRAVLRHSVANWLLALCMGGHVAGAAEIPDPINPLCKGYIGEFNDDKIYTETRPFDRKRQKGWYHRWWSGKCGKVPYPDRWTCTTSKGAAKEGSVERDKSWHSMVEKFAAHPSGDKVEIAKAMCKLGELIGLEWARDNDVRCIHTSDLPKLWADLEVDESRTPLKRIENVRGQVMKILNDCRTKKRLRLEARRRRTP